MTVVATWDNDPAQHEPFLVCQECGEKLCSVEEGDDFDVLVRVVQEHTCGRDRLEYLRSQLRAENISQGELHELQSLADHIEPGDVELLEAAGVPEHGAARKIVYIENAIEELAKIIHEAAIEHMAPNWTIDLIDGGLDAPHLRIMAGRWREYEFEPKEFAVRLELLADALDAMEGQ